MKSMNRLPQWVVCLLLGCCLSACQVKRPKEVLTDSRMGEVLYDYHIAKAMGEEYASSENFKRVLYVEAVYRKHGITQEQFDSSMVWFSRHPAVLAKIYEKVNARLRATRDGVNHLIALREDKPIETQPGDSMEVWAWKPYYKLEGVPMANRLTFLLPADGNFENRDTLRWSLRLRMPHSSKRDEEVRPVMAMQMVYEKDTLISAFCVAERSGVQTLSLAADTLGAIKEVRGFVYLPAGSASASLLVDRISLMRYHAHDSLVIATDSLEQTVEKPAVQEESRLKQPQATAAEPKKLAPVSRPRPGAIREMKRE